MFQGPSPMPWDYSYFLFVEGGLISGAPLQSSWNRNHKSGSLGRSLGSDKCEIMLHFVWRLCREDDFVDLEVLTWCGVQPAPPQGDPEFGAKERQGRGGREGCNLQHPNKELWDLTGLCVGGDRGRQCWNHHIVLCHQKWRSQWWCETRSCNFHFLLGLSWHSAPNQTVLDSFSSDL